MPNYDMDAGQREKLMQLIVARHDYTHIETLDDLEHLLSFMADVNHVEIRGMEYLKAIQTILARRGHVLADAPLRDCPLCGSTAVVEKYNCGWRVYCCNDKCACTSGIFTTPEAAIAKWNRRTVDGKEI